MVVVFEEWFLYPIFFLLFFSGSALGFLFHRAFVKKDKALFEMIFLAWIAGLVFMTIVSMARGW